MPARQFFMLSISLFLSMQETAVSAAEREVVTEDMKLYSSVPFGQTPANGFIYLNNTFGRGNLVNGLDYIQRLVAVPATFPIDATIEWDWKGGPCSGCGAFAYSYPVINYGGSNYDNPFHVIGPWPQQIERNSVLKVTYDVILNGNLDSYDTLLDIFVTAEPTSENGDYVAEISFFPQSNNAPLLGRPHEFSFGTAYVGSQGTPPQICISPVIENKRRNILSGTIDLNEILRHLVATGHLSGKEWLRGVQFGVEVQVPAKYNSPPYRGSMTINNLAYEWK